MTPAGFAGRLELSLISWLWSDIHDFFDTDDGSRPEIHVNYVDPGAVITGYSMLRERAARTVTQNPYYWSMKHNERRSLEALPNPAALVVAGDAEPFHVVFGGIQAGGVSIPNLGVFVFPDQLALDYRMGPEWGPSQVAALFALLGELIELDPRSAISLEESMLPEVAARFHRAYKRWYTERRLTEG